MKKLKVPCFLEAYILTARGKVNTTKYSMSDSVRGQTVQNDHFGENDENDPYNNNLFI